MEEVTQLYKEMHVLQERLSEIAEELKERDHCFPDPDQEEEELADLLQMFQRGG